MRRRQKNRLMFSGLAIMMSVLALTVFVLWVTMGVAEAEETSKAIASGIYPIETEIKLPATEWQGCDITISNDMSVKEISDFIMLTRVSIVERVDKSLYGENEWVIEFVGTNGDILVLVPNAENKISFNNLVKFISATPDFFGEGRFTAYGTLAILHELGIPATDAKIFEEQNVMQIQVEEKTYELQLSEYADNMVSEIDLYEFVGAWYGI